MLCSSVDGNELEALGEDLDSSWTGAISWTNWLDFTIFLLAEAHQHNLLVFHPGRSGSENRFDAQC